MVARNADKGIAAQLLATALLLSLVLFDAALATTTAGKPGVVVVSIGPSNTRLRTGDVITAVDDKPVASVQDLAREIGPPELGGSFKIDVIRGSQHFEHVVTVSVVRGGRSMEVEVTLAERPAPQPAG